MTTYDAPHRVTDEAKFAAIVEAFRTGRPVPPVAVQGYTAFTGSHRIAAYEAAYKLWSQGAEGWEDASEPELDVVEVSDEDYAAACDLIHCEHHTETRECNLFAAALYAATGDESLRAALEDQRHEYEATPLPGADRA